MHHAWLFIDWEHTKPSYECSMFSQTLIPTQRCRWAAHLASCSLPSCLFHLPSISPSFPLWILLRFICLHLRPLSPSHQPQRCRSPSMCSFDVCLSKYVYVCLFISCISGFVLLMGILMALCHCQAAIWKTDSYVCSCVSCTHMSLEDMHAVWLCPDWWFLERNQQSRKLVLYVLSAWFRRRVPTGP